MIFHVKISPLVYVEVKCIDCGSTEVIKFGKRANGHQRYRCKSCKKTFQLEYTYKACEPGIKEKIVDMAMNASGTRDTARTLKIARGTVASTLSRYQNMMIPYHGKCINVNYAVMVYLSLKGKVFF